MTVASTTTIEPTPIGNSSDGLKQLARRKRASPLSRELILNIERMAVHDYFTLRIE